MCTLRAHIKNILVCLYILKKKLKSMKSFMKLKNHILTIHTVETRNNIKNLMLKINYDTDIDCLRGG